ncbi:hypothetical protein [Flavobacterium rhizosphaerae]|uniref:Lipoprotein n=1 Tax=Flavobacterium rhizosphaerae TaxID=3163298 RepID=A0ABW8YU12_9FLAO
MKLTRIGFFVVLFTCSAATFIACNNDDSNKKDLDLVGQEGNPRFNLQFTNHENVDLDLYVQTPNGVILYYANSYGDGGELDVDCMCSDCPQGANENIFWKDGTAPSGTYTYWVEYYEDCSEKNNSADFTVRVVKNGEVLATKSGSLNNGESSHWTHEQP